MPTYSRRTDDRSRLVKISVSSIWIFQLNLHEELRDDDNRIVVCFALCRPISRMRTLSLCHSMKSEGVRWSSSLPNNSFMAVSLRCSLIIKIEGRQRVDSDRKGGAEKLNGLSYGKDRVELVRSRNRHAKSDVLREYKRNTTAKVGFLMHQTQLKRGSHMSIKYFQAFQATPRQLSVQAGIGGI